MLNQKTSPMKMSSINSMVQRSVFLLGLFFFGLNLNAQYIDQLDISVSNADKMFDIKNYQEAIRQFESLLKQEPSNFNYKLKLAKSYTYSQINKRRGLELLQELNKSSEKTEEITKELVIAYFKNYEFDQAISIFKELITNSNDETQKQAYADWISQVERSKKMLADPVWVEFENLGKKVNSDAPDYLPVVEPDESTLLFTTRRSGVVGNLYDFGGYRTADIYSVNHKRNSYSRAKSVGSPNTYGNEQTAGKSENGNYVIYNVNSEDHFNDLFVSEKGRKSYMPAKVFDSEEVNQKKSNEMGGTLSNDGATFYFCSDRPDGFGGFDIYVVKRLPNGNWSSPKNLGEPINTPDNEQYPNLMDQGKTLYFSSNGHPGMGDMDLFKSTLNTEDETWSQPVNLGHPINTPDDDLTISFAENQRYAYIAANREDGFGDLDIYRVTFLEEKDNYTLLNGRVITADSIQVTLEVEVEVYDLNDESLHGTYKLNKKTGKYSAILPAGKFRIEVSSVGDFKDYSAEITLLGKNDFQAEKKHDIILLPK